MTRVEQQIADKSNELKRTVFMLKMAAESFRGQDFKLNPERCFGFRSSKELMKFANANAYALSLQLEAMQ